jgi:AcrR family transcriptional regulator
MKTTRAYRMGARAEAALDTHRRVLEAGMRLFGERPFDEVSLADVAADAGVTVQTVLRRFGSKEGLVEACAALGTEQVRAARWAAPAGDVAAALRGLVEHYEEWGDRSLRLLAQEERVPAVREVTARGRALHHEWVDHVFEEALAKARGAARTRLRASLVAATDVYVWKILRRDLGLEVATTERTLREMVLSILG